MTREHFFAHKRGIKQAMTETLTLSKALGRPLKPYCVRKDMLIINMGKGSDPTHLDTIQTINKLMLEGWHLKLEGRTYSSGRYDYFDSAVFKLTKDVVRDSITEEQVKIEMQKLLKKKLNLYSFSTIHCKVLDLFKQGKVTWDEVVEAHKDESCEI